MIDMTHPGQFYKMPNLMALYRQTTLLSLQSRDNKIMKPAIRIRILPSQPPPITQ